MKLHIAILIVEMHFMIKILIFRNIQLYFLLGEQKQEGQLT